MNSVGLQKISVTDFLKERSDLRGLQSIFFNRIFSVEYAKFCIKNVGKLGFKMISPYSEGGGIILSAFYKDTSKDGVFGNFVLLSDTVTEKRYIILQRVNFVSAVVFPEENLFVQYRNSPDDVAVIEAAINNLKLLPSRKDSPARFLGFLFGAHGRPYHQIHDFLPLYCHAIIETNSSLKLIKNKSFISPEQINKKAEWIILDKKIQAWNDSFFLLTGSVFENSEEKRFELYNAFEFLNKFTNLIEHDSKKNFDTWKSKHDPVVWIGVCAQKSRFINSIKAISAALTNILSEYPSAGFVVDGLTAPYGFSEDLFSKKKCHGEIDSFDILTEITGNPSAFFSLIGKHTSLKNYVARRVDFYIGNAGTDSVWPCAAQRKPGLAHSSNSMRKHVHRGYVHPRTFLFPSELTEDIETGLVFHHVKYKVDVEKFADLSLKTLKSCLKYFKESEILPIGENEVNQYLLGCERKEAVYYKIIDKGSSKVILNPGAYTIKIDLVHGLGADVKYILWNRNLGAVVHEFKVSSQDFFLDANIELELIVEFKDIGVFAFNFHGVTIFER